MPRLLLFITLPLYLLDQLTKFWTVTRFSEPPPGHFSSMDLQVVVVENFFHLSRVHNQGVAFGFGNGSAWAPVVFMFVPLVALCAIRYFWVKGLFSHIVSKVAVALLMCGIFGNLTDRLVQGFLLSSHRGESFWSRLSSGYVVDFLSFKLPYYDKLVPISGGWWPSFNVADSCICVAACLLFIGGLWEEKRQKQKAGEQAKP